MKNEPEKAINILNIDVSLGNAMVLNNVSMSVNQGSFHVLLGPNGAGKTTLMRSINRLIHLTRGEILIFNHNIAAIGSKDLAKRVCYVPQQHITAYAYSVLDFILMGRNPYISVFSSPSPQDRVLAWEALHSLGIEELGRRDYISLSGGERQLVLLARGLAQAASVMLLDEPTAHLDYHYQHVVLDAVKKLVINQNKTALVTLHDPNLAIEYGDCITVLNKSIIAQVDRDESSFESIMEEVLTALYSYDIRIRQIDGKHIVIRK